ncbi:MAG: hypothetical protein BWY88_00452 [Synergistetes bacterium ADurb.Bin520]|nr:MAG: hypothetical protein BWY88_00452 [Synergistetes bacterium ADurb.Bin520]
MVRHFVVLVLLLLIAPAAAQVTAEVGETWIRWEWGAYGNETLVIVDGVSQGSAERGLYYLSDIRPAEEHQLALVNASTGTQVDSLRVKTLTPLSTILFFLGIMIILAILCMVMQDPARVILTGALGSAVGLYLFTLCLGHGALWLVVLGLVGFQAIFVVLALYNLLEDALRWW